MGRAVPVGDRAPAAAMNAPPPSASPADDWSMESGVTGDAAMAPDAVVAGQASLHLGFTALVVEDNMLIAMDAEEALRELGASAVRLCPNVASALECIAAAAFDVALLDVSLGDDTSEAIAMALRARGTPFVMTTGFGDYISDIAAYAGAPVLTKPYAPSHLASALAQVMD